MSGAARLAEGALCLLLAGCDSCGREVVPSADPRAAAPSVKSANANERLTIPPSPALRQAEIAATRPIVPPLLVPKSQIYEVGGLSPGERRPLLIFLHGLGATGKIAFDVLRLAELGARERVFVVAPDGSVDSQRRQFWNAGPACCNFDHQQVDDVARLGSLIDTWRARPDVDPARIYVTGHSNGGFMTERLACAFGDRIAAAASMSGAAPATDIACVPGAHLALLEVHGDADEIVRYEGGTVFDRADLAVHPSAEQGFHDWAKRLDCTGVPVRAPNLDLDPKLPGPETAVEQYPSCARGSVTLWTVHGGSHYVGTGQQAFEAIWQFLSAHHQ